MKLRLKYVIFYEISNKFYSRVEVYDTFKLLKLPNMILYELANVARFIACVLMLLSSIDNSYA